MRFAVTILLLLLPGALAAFLHRKLKGNVRGIKQLAVFAAYAAMINLILCGFKLLRGAGIAAFWDWFSPPLSFVFYLAAACLMALILPLFSVLISGKRFAVRCTSVPSQNISIERAVPWNAKRVVHTLLRMGVVLIAGILIGALLVTAVYALPLENIQKNVLRSAATMEKEGSYPFLYQNWRSTRLDNFTDSIMMLIASYPGDQGIIKNAMLSTYVRYADHDPAQGLVKWSTGDESGLQTHSYSRYWHGYLVWLKPLLEILEYQQIRVLNAILQTFLILSLLFVMFKKGWKRLMLPFLIMALFLTPIALFKSFQFSWIFYVFMFSSLMLMLYFEKLKRRSNFYLLFLSTGMTTSYVDFLTYPLITLGVPLVIYLVLRRHRTARQGVLDIAGLALSWGIGYVGMWGGKWLLSTLLTDSNVLLSVQDNIAARMSYAYAEETFSWIDIVQRNIEAFNHWIYMWPFLLCLVSYALLYGRERMSLFDCNLAMNSRWLGTSVLPLLLVAVSPFVWFFVASNHTYIHYWYAHRTLAISVFAVLAVFAQPLSKADEPEH